MHEKKWKEFGFLCLQIFFDTNQFHMLLKLINAPSEFRNRISSFVGRALLSTIKDV